MSLPSESPRVSVIQDGARLHYAVPVAMQQAGILERVFTDCFTRSSSIESFVTRLLRPVSPALARRMAERFTPELDTRKVHTNARLIFSQFVGRWYFTSDIEYYAWMSALTAKWVLDEGFGDSNAVFGFVRNILPGLCSTARHHGLKVVTDQIIAPFPIEHAEALKQQDRFPGWAHEPAMVADRVLTDFELDTWESSDIVTCASEYVREGLISQGVDARKIVVVPYPYNVIKTSAADRRGRRGPVVLGFVGQVGLRKGAPYFFQVAKRLDPAAIRCTMVGAITLDHVIAEQHRGEVELIGPTPRSNVSAWMDTFDIFLFPSTCEGSAGAVIEAMAAGLPVIASPNSGTPVRHGIDGFITTYDDVDRMADYVAQLTADKDLRLRMGDAARQRAMQFGLDQYGRKMKELYSNLLIPK